MFPNCTPNIFIVLVMETQVVSVMPEDRLLKPLPDEVLKTVKVCQDQDSNQMTSSVASLTTSSSLASPVDSGVQLLDSESSEIASLMSMSGIGSDCTEKAKKQTTREEGTDVEDEIRENEICQQPTKEGKIINYLTRTFCLLLSNNDLHNQKL